MSPDFSEIGFSVVHKDGRSTYLYIVGEPFDPNRSGQYRKELFDKINSIRQKGVTCFGTPYPPKPAFIWSDDLGKAAQVHSDDMATWPFPGPETATNPHVGSDGSRAKDRVDRLGCIYKGVGENISFNASDPTSPALAWTGQIEGTACQDGDKAWLSEVFINSWGLALQQHQ